METVDESKSTTTLVGGRPGSLSSEMSQTVGAGSGSRPDENGVGFIERGNMVGKGCFSGGGVAPVWIRKRVVETETLAKASFAGQNTADLGGLTKTTKGMGSDLGVEKNDRNGVDKTAVQRNLSISMGDDSNRKVGLNGNGISLVVEVHASSGNVNENDKKCGGYEADKGSVTVMPGSVPKFGEKGDIMETNVNGDQQEEDEEDLGKDNAEQDEDDDREDVADQEHGYSVGDFVWGKIRSHPWWPGQIYDPSDASQFAAKRHQKNRFLVAYFGDGSFSWCSPSQLKPFLESFKEMSKQSTSKSFVNAVQKAVDEIGGLLELKMMCLCVPDDHRIGLTRAVAVNAGIKAGILVPEGDIGKLLILQLKPANLLAVVRDAARGISVSSTLELTLLKSWLSAFYRAKGCCSLAIYHDPLTIEGLEDKNRSEEMETTDSTLPVEVPIDGPFKEDWLSLPVGPGSSQTNQPMISDHRLYQRRKQKSVAELMKEDMVVKAKSKKGSVVGEGTDSSKPMSGKKIRKGDNETENQDGSVLKSPLGWKRGRKKKAEISESHTVENKASTVENGVVGEEEVGGYPKSRKQKRSKVSSVENDEGEAKEQVERNFVSRERKKSKYLSPPYTSPTGMLKNSSSKKGMEAEFEKISNVAQVGERMSKAASQVIGSPPILKCNAEIFKKKQSKELIGGHHTSGSLSSQAAKQRGEVIHSIEINATANEVLSGVQIAALNPLYLTEKGSLDMITGFISTFRSSIYMNGSNYKTYLKHQHGGKRKSMDSDLGLQEEAPYQPRHKSPVTRSQRKGNLKKTERKSDIPKVQQAGGASGMEENHKEAGSISSPVALMVSFPRGFSLPSKSDLIKIFCQFGDLNELETNVSYKSCCARVVFVNSSDTERAFNLVLKNSPFGDANIKYRLWSNAQNAASTLGRTPESPVASRPPDVEGSQLRFIRQKLEKMVSMLENGHDRISPGVKSSLEDEVKGLLEEVCTMANSTSS